MEYEDLGILLVLDECKSINKAANKLFMSPTGLSKKISSLEKELGTSLLNRTSTGCDLTDNGKIVLDYTKKINDLIDECMGKIKGSDVLKVRVGFSFLYDRNFFYQLQAAKKYIDKNCELMPISLDDVFIENSMDKILSYIGTDIDVLLDVEGNVLSDEYATLPFAENKIGFLVPKRHKLYNKKTIKLEDIKDLKILKLTDGFYKSADEITNYIKNNCDGVTFEELESSFISIGSYCESKNAVYLCLDSFKFIEPNEKIIPLDFVDEVPFSMIYRKDSPKELIDIINNLYKVIKRGRRR